jgi:hypothetical protein
MRVSYSTAQAAPAAHAREEAKKAARDAAKCLLW